MPPKPDMRACLICSYLQKAKQFMDDGCPNCEDLLEMKGSAQRVEECTSTLYDGMVAMIDPEKSWVARWQRIDKRRPGFYAVRVTGRPPQDVIDSIEARGGVYRPRDQAED